MTVGGEAVLRYHPVCADGCDERTTMECEVDEDISGRDFSSTLQWSEEIGDMVIIEEDGIEA